MRTRLLATLAVLAIACTPKNRPTPSEIPPSLDEPIVEPSVERMVFMHVMLDRADRARRHIISGDVAGARSRAKEMETNMEVPWLPDAYRPFVEDAFVQVNGLQNAEDLETASGHVASLAAACGSCHEQAGVQDQVKRIVSPGQRDDDDRRMSRHMWAADWMWAGLITADDELYSLGASLFLSDNMPEMPIPVEEMPELELLTVRIDSIAAHARNATEPQQQAEQYGQLISNCASCHDALGFGGPSPH